MSLSCSTFQVSPAGFVRAQKPFPLLKQKIQSPIVKSPLSYPGGKTRAVNQILTLIPRGVDRICSPFLGGGSIELACASKGIQVYAYDAFEPLVIFWQSLLEDAPALSESIKKHYPLTREHFRELQKEYFRLEDKREKASVFFTLNKSAFSGVTFSGGMSLIKNSFTGEAIEKLGLFKVDHFAVERADFKESLKKHKHDFLYLDPPYLLNSSLYGYKGELHNGFDHEGLAALLRKRENWILSYNDCPKIRELYKGHKFLLAEWSYSMNESKKSNEVVILSKDFVRVMMWASPRQIFGV